MYDRTVSDEFQCLHPLKTNTITPDVEIQEKIDISNYRCTFLPTLPIFMKLETPLEFTNRVQIKTRVWLYDKLQDGGDRHLVTGQSSAP